MQPRPFARPRRRLAHTLLLLLAAASPLVFASTPSTPLTITGSAQLGSGGLVEVEAAVACTESLGFVTLRLIVEDGDLVEVTAGGRALPAVTATPEPDGLGLVQRRYDLRLDPGMTIHARIRPAAVGRHSIRLDVSAPGRGQDLWGDRYAFFYTRTADGLLSSWPQAESPELAATRCADAPSVAQTPTLQSAPTAPASALGVEVGGLDAPSVTAGTLTVSGWWFMYDQDNVHIPQIERMVQLLDGSAQVVATAYTDLSGYYQFAPIANPGTFYVRLWAQTTYQRIGGADTLKVRNQLGSVYTTATSTVSGVPDGTYSMGVWDVADGSSSEPAFWAFNALQQVWRFFYFLHGDGSHAPGSMSARWYPGSTDGTYYQGGGEIHLTHDSPSSRSVVCHEAGHNVMYNAYNGWWPIDDCPSPHYLGQASGIHCGWTEGFADWVAIAVTNDQYFRFADGSAVNMEEHLFNTGAEVEGNVAATMWDWIDGANELDFDMHTDPARPLWDTVWNHRDQTMCDYFDSTRHQGVKRSRDNELRQNLITTCTTCLQDFYEPDDHCAAAKNFPVGSFVDQATQCSSPDYMRVDVQRDWNYVWETDELGAYGDTVLTLFDPTCDPENTLAYGDDKYVSRWPQASRIDWRSDRDGTVYLETWSFSGYGANRSYDLSSRRYCATPTTPVVVEPVDGGSVCGGAVVLRWSDDGTSHNVIVDGNYVPACFGARDHCTVTGLSPGPHWWQVEAFLACGSHSYGPQFQFTVLDPGSTPAGTPALTLGGSGISWPPVPGAVAYDVVRGDLAALATTGGDFAAATQQCLASATLEFGAPFATQPDPGQGYFVLSRARGCSGHGSYDDGSPGRAAPRDAEIAASAGACP